MSGKTDELTTKLRSISRLAGALSQCCTHQAELNTIDDISSIGSARNLETALEEKTTTLLLAFQCEDLHMKLVAFHCKVAGEEFATKLAAANALRKIANEIATRESPVPPTDHEVSKALTSARKKA